MYALIFCVLGVLPQSEREANVYRRARVRREAPAPVVQVVPQTVINVYTPTYAPTFMGSGYISPAYGGYGYGRPAWPPRW